MTINTNPLGRILSVQKILVGGIEKTPEGAIADGKTAPYMLIHGSTGNDAVVDNNGNLVCMLKGSENVPIAQDADGNMNAVMKGDYAGALKTWKVDDQGRGEMFINDNTDAWGRVKSIGLGEHCVRSHYTAPPYLYTKSGSVVYWDNFESPTMKVIPSGSSGGGCARSNDYAHFGDFSMKMSTGNVTDSYACAAWHLLCFRGGKVGMSMSLLAQSPSTYLTVEILYYDGENKHFGMMKLDLGDKKLYVGYPTCNIEVGTIDYYVSGSYPTFVPIKLTIDIDNDLYNFANIAWDEIDLSANALYTDTSSIARHLEFSVRMYTKVDFAYDSYLDDVIMTENE